MSRGRGSGTTGCGQAGRRTDPRRQTAQAVTGCCRIPAASPGTVVRVKGPTLRAPRFTPGRGRAVSLFDTYKHSSVLIEGHGDEHGTVGYNLELGKRRALAVKEYLVDLGVEESRMDIVSY
ncbi:MAG: OmpA family protein, partial [Nitrospira sp.]|nr:OmpA family protein [Nitrospira sp.]